MERTQRSEDFLLLFFMIARSRTYKIKFDVYEMMKIFDVNYLLLLLLSFFDIYDNRDEEMTKQYHVDKLR